MVVSATPLRSRAHWVALGWLGVLALVYLSLTPSPVPAGFDGGDKLQHLLAYAAIMFWFGALHPGKAQVHWAAGFVALGIVLEVLQSALGVRTGDAADALANTLGVSMGYLLARTRLGEVFLHSERILGKSLKQAGNRTAFDRTK